MCFGADAVASAALQALVGKVAVRRLVGKGGGANAAARANAAVVRLDMAIATCCPLVVGVTTAALGHDGAAYALAAAHVAGAVGVLVCAREFYGSAPADADAYSPPPPPSVPGAIARLDPFTRGAVDCYCLLYFTVLSPHGVTVAWLRGVAGASPATIGAFQSAAQAAGLLATVATPRAVARHGTRRVALASNALQLAANGAGVAALLVFDAPPLFLAALVLSRLGLWAYDLVERELLQTSRVTFYF